MSLKFKRTLEEYFNGSNAENSLKSLRMIRDLLFKGANLGEETESSLKRWTKSKDIP